MTDLKEKISCLEKPIAALMLDPLDKDAIEEAIKLWKRFNLIPVTKMYQVSYCNYGELSNTLLTTFNREKARGKFIEEVTDRFIELNLENDEFFEEDEEDEGEREEKLKSIILANEAIDLIGDPFCIDSSNSWREEDFHIYFEEIDVEF